MLDAFSPSRPTPRAPQPASAWRAGVVVLGLLAVVGGCAEAVAPAPPSAVGKADAKSVAADVAAAQDAGTAPGDVAARVGTDTAQGDDTANPAADAAASDAAPPPGDVTQAEDAETAPETQAAGDIAAGAGDAIQDTALSDTAVADGGAADAGGADAGANPLDAGPNPADASAADASAADAGVVLPADAPTDTNLIVQVTATVDGIAGAIHLAADNGGSGGGPPGGMDGGPTALVVKNAALPAKLYVHLAPGEWQLMVWVVGSSGFTIALGMSCNGAVPGKVTVKDGVITEASVPLVPMMGQVSPTKACSMGASGAWASLLSQMDAVFTPASKDGAAHFMQGHMVGSRLFVAGSQDGYVTFDFPIDPAQTKPLANWSVVGGQMCNRITQLDDVLYCSSRNGYLNVAKLGPGQKVAALDKVWLSYIGDLGSEGMVVVDGFLYIAAHRKGIWRIDKGLAGKPLIIAPPGDSDVWDVRVFDATHLVVGTDQGVYLMDIQLAGGAKAPWSALVPTPGPAANLHVDGTKVWVGDLSGRVHGIQYADMANPKIVSSPQLPSSAYGVWGQGTRGYAATGHYVIALDWLASGGGVMLVRDASPSPRFALDVDPLDGNTLLASEFQDIRRLHVEEGQNQDRPVVMTSPEVDVPIATVGGKLAGQLRIYNAGQQPAMIIKVSLEEGFGLPVQELKGPWKLSQGQVMTLPFSFNKTTKGVTDHKLLLMTDAVGQDSIPIAVKETTWLHLGDTLPPLKYNDLSGKSWDVNAGLAGKVGVVLVAAHSCPVALMGMAAAARQLKPWIDQGKVAAFGINPWDDNFAPEVPILALPFPMLHTPLTTKDSHDWSQILDETLGQPISFGPPMPIVYIVGKKGQIVMAMWGYQPLLVDKIVQEELVK